MDSFSLDSIRDAFEADVTRYIEQARASVQQCLDRLPERGRDQALGDRIAAVAGGDEGGRDWLELARATRDVEGFDALLRGVLEHVLGSCATLESVLERELAGVHGEASDLARHQLGASEQQLRALRHVLAGEPMAATASVGANVSATDDPASLLREVGALRGDQTVDEQLEDAEHCYHSIRGSSGMVALQEMSECASVGESLLQATRELLSQRTARLQDVARLCQALAESLGGDSVVSEFAMSIIEDGSGDQVENVELIADGPDETVREGADDDLSILFEPGTADPTAGQPVNEAPADADGDTALRDAADAFSHAFESEIGDLSTGAPTHDASAPVDGDTTLRDVADAFSLAFEAEAGDASTGTPANQTPVTADGGTPSPDAADAFSLDFETGSDSAAAGEPAVDAAGTGQPTTADTADDAGTQVRSGPPTPDADAFSTIDFDAPSVVQPPEGPSRISALETALFFGGSAKAEGPPHGAEPAAEDPAEFGEDLFDSPSLAIPGEPSPAAADAAPEQANADFEFDGPTADRAPAAPVLVDDVDPELLEIFMEEARQCLPDLRKSLARVAANPGDTVAWLDLSRHFHLLKGSAGTVGLTQLATIAGGLEDRAEAFGERQRSASSVDIAGIRGETSRMLAACRIELDEAPAAPEAPTVVAGELAEVFVTEARQIMADAEVILHAATPERLLGEQERQSLAGLMHRLKGSAVLHGSERVGSVAARLNELCEADDWTRAAQTELLDGVAELRREIGMPAASAVRTDLHERAVPVTIEAEPAVWEAFQIEVQEAIDQIDRIALELDGSAEPRRRLDDAFRCMHTLKGSCNTVGISPTGAMLHEVESFLETLQQAAVLPPLGAIARVLLDTVDAVRRNLAQASTGTVTDYLPRVLARIDAVMHDRHGKSTLVPSRGEHPSAPASAGSSRKASRPGSGSSDSAPVAGRSMLRVSAERLDRLMDLIGELVVQRSQLRSTAGSMQRLQKALKKSRLQLFTTIDRFREQYEFHGLSGARRARRNAAAEPATEVPRPANAKAAEAGFSDLELDHYEDINILARSLEEVDGDIQQIQAQIDAEIEGFQGSSDSFGALISSLQNEITEARMVAVDQLFLRLRRPIRDAADRLGKQVRVTTVGDDVTLDKTIIDQLFAPMLHLVRNAVSHGIESSGDRGSAGKDAAGTITLSARQESGRIVIEVRDDGRGLDLEALRRIGVERGLLPPDVPADDPRVRDLIFVSGLSTKKQVDEVSGRGVGCDVVRRAIEHLSGVIDVITEAGRGTTFRITMPLTLAIYRALLVKHAGLTFALPIGFAERILDNTEARLFESSGVRRLRLDDQFLEVRDLSQILALPVAESQSETGVTVVLRLGPDRIAVKIDEIVGQDEIVVKSLGDVLTGHEMFSGVTIDGEGSLILILDVTGLFNSAGRSAMRRNVDLGVTEQRAATPVAAATSRRVKVLYADDSLSVRKAAEKFLGDIGADVVLAVDGLDALERLRAQSFDMVFTDLEMPRMHGFELLREMRYVPTFKDIPVVVVTSRSGDKHRQQAEKLGCNGYLGKPFTPASLQEQICRLTGAVAGAGGLVVERVEAAR